MRRRAGGEPLQYILGTQPFGDLEILCKKGVLIPRADTEAYTLKVAGLVKELLEAQTLQMYHENGVNAKNGTKTLRILDMCTGTGCISLLLYLMCAPRITGSKPNDSCPFSSNTSMTVLGVDLSETALDLARANVAYNISTGSLPSEAAVNLHFRQADCQTSNSFSSSTPSDPTDLHDHRVPSIFSLLKEFREQNRQKSLATKSEWDIVISNPPYISPDQYEVGGTTSKSVRQWEPRDALVPPDIDHLTLGADRGRLINNDQNKNSRGDEFYPHLLNVAKEVNAKLIVLEVGDTQQAKRVRDHASNLFGAEGALSSEIWRDEGFVDEEQNARNGTNGMIQEGSGRAVVIWRHDWATWRLKSNTNQGHVDVPL